MKNINRNNILWLFLILLLVPISLYTGYKYGYKKTVEKENSRIKTNFIQSTAPITKNKKNNRKKSILNPKAQKSTYKNFSSKKEEVIRNLYLLNCKEASKNILSFISYLSQKSYMQKYCKNLSLQKRITYIVTKLKENPPIPEGESFDPNLMIKNIYFMFRVLSAEDIQLIKDIIKNESDQLEYIIRCYYIWLISQDNQNRCPDYHGLLIPIKVAYKYAAFFLNTIGGRAYLFRRPNTLRLLITYYSIMLVHYMHQKGVKECGINICKMIPNLIDELSRFNELKFQDYYITSLENVLSFEKQ